MVTFFFFWYIFEPTPIRAIKANCMAYIILIFVSGKINISIMLFYLKLVSRDSLIGSPQAVLPRLIIFKFSQTTYYEWIRTCGPRINTGTQFLVAELQHQLE